MKLILFLLKASWRIVAAAAIVGGLSGVASMVLLVLTLHAMRRPDGSAPVVIGLFAALCLVVLLARISSQILLSRLTLSTVSRVRLGLCRKILASPLRDLEEIGMGRMLHSLTSDVTAVTQVINVLPSLVVSVIMLVCGSVFLGLQSMKLLGCAVVFCAGGVASYVYFASFARRFLKEARDAQETVVRNLRELIDGAKQLKMHGQRRRVFIGEVLEPTETVFRARKYRGDCVHDAAIAWGRLLFFVALGLLVFAWPKYFPGDMDTAKLVNCVFAVIFLVSPLDQLMAFLPSVAWAAVAVERIEQLGFMLDETAVEEAEAAPLRQWEQIELAGVTHAYRREGRSDGFVLGPIDLAVRPGEILFIVGGNGSGKTTLAKLLTGLYVPESGAIRLDGRPITAENREGYRQLFSAVFDDAAIFGSLWGLEDEDLDRRAREYLELLELDHVVSVNGGTFSTTKLSRGQRKRLALLTAYLEDRPIYVFDEWAADQDPMFRRLFYLRLLPDLQRRGKAIVAITHDDHYFGVADCVIKLDEGKIAESSLVEALVESTRDKL